MADYINPTNPNQENQATSYKDAAPPLISDGVAPVIKAAPNNKFTLNGFISDIKKRGVLLAHSFDVNIPIPEYLRSKYQNVGDSFSIRCEAASLPGMAIASADFSRYGYGPTESIAHNVTYDNITLVFTLDANSEVHKFFYDWIGIIVNFTNPTGDLSKTGGVGGFGTYEVGYKNKYSVDLQVNTYDQQLKNVSKVTMYRAYPKAINPIDLSWGSVDTLVKLSIPFSFREYTIEFKK